MFFDCTEHAPTTKFDVIVLEPGVEVNARSVVLFAQVNMFFSSGMVFMTIAGDAANHFLVLVISCHVLFVNVFCLRFRNEFIFRSILFGAMVSCVADNEEVGGLISSSSRLGSQKSLVSHETHCEIQTLLH